MGLISLTSTGVGLSANITGVAGTTTKAAAKVRFDANGVQALGSGATGVKVALWSVDSDGAGTNTKWELYLENDASHNVRATLSAPNNSAFILSTSFMTAATYPSAGNFLEIYTGWDNTQPKQQIVIYDASGTIITDGVHTANSITTTAAGVLPTTGGVNGRVSLNRGLAGTTRAGIYDGLWMYNVLLFGTTQWMPGASGDGNVQAGWNFDDVGSPGTASAQAGGQGMVWTAGQFTYLGGGAWLPNATVPFRQPQAGSTQAVVRASRW